MRSWFVLGSIRGLVRADSIVPIDRSKSSHLVLLPKIADSVVECRVSKHTAGKIMITRVWHTLVQESRAADYERFAQEISLPMFRLQKGYLGVIMAREKERCIVISFWESAASIEALDTSPTYKATVAKILAQGFLFGEQTTQVFETHLIEMLDARNGPST